MGTVVPTPAGSTPLDESIIKTKTLHNAATGDGDGTVFDITGMATIQLTVNPTSYTGTVTFKASEDGTNFDNILGTKQGTTTVASSVANPGSTKSIWEFQVAGLTKFKAPLTSSGGTSITVTAHATPQPNANPVGSTIGTAVIQANSGTALAADQTNSELRTSTYVKKTVAGDTALTLGAAAKADSVPVVMPTDQMLQASADGLTAANVLTAVRGLFNGTTVDRERGNTEITVLASAARTTTQTQADQTNYNHRGIMVILDMTEAAASPSVTLEIDAKDPASGAYKSLLTGAAVTTVSTNIYTVYPGAPATANVSANSPLPRTWRIKVTANNANSGTYSVGASLIV